WGPRPPRSTSSTPYPLAATRPGLRSRGYPPVPSSPPESMYPPVPTSPPVANPPVLGNPPVPYSPPVPPPPPPPQSGGPPQFTTTSRLESTPHRAQGRTSNERLPIRKLMMTNLRS